MIITNASGALNQKYEVGETYFVNSFLNFPPKNLNLPTIVNAKYPLEFKEEGTYAFQQGPSLNTLSEYKMLFNLGADFVGMSSIQECNYLNEIGIQNYTFTIPVCQYAPFESIREPSHKEVLQISNKATPKLIKVINKIL